MAERITIECDVCGAAKRETNHWWRGRMVPKLGGILIFPASAKVKREPGDVDLCGREHAHGWADTQMDRIGRGNTNAAV